MSLIRQRKLRKKNFIDARRGMPMAKLVTLLVITVGAIWYLGWRF
ncbi:MAG: hypothetical protein ABL963_10610 [Longimicrobiales bacterium]